MPTVSRSARLALLFLVPLLVAGHLWFWYLPRERPAKFGESALAREMIVGRGSATSLWVPYPHQNLALLADATGDRQEYLAALFRVLDAPPPALPRFGPLALPPARELVVAVDPEGGRMSVAVEVYPAVALFARLAGKVAGNPWLSGGAVQMGGRPATVIWQGRRWTISTAEPPLTLGLAPGSQPTLDRLENATGGSVESLAVLRTSTPPEPLPAGLYHLTRRGRGLDILSGRAAAIDPILDLCARPAVAGVWLLERRPADDGVDNGRMGKGRAARAMAVTLGEATSSFGLPEVATFRRGSAPAWNLPGFDLLRSLTGGGAERRAGDWRLEAFTEPGLDRAALLLPSLEALLTDPAAARLELAGALDLDAQRHLLEGLIGLADGFPLVPERYRVFLHDVQTLGRPLDGFDKASLVILNRPAALTLRLAER